MRALKAINITKNVNFTTITVMEYKKVGIQD